MTIFVEPGHINEHPFNHARIIYGNASGATVSATGADTDYPAALVLTDTTYERWKPAASGDSITMTFTAGNYNAVGIAAHSGLAFTLEVRQVGSLTFEPVTMYRPDDGETLSADFTEPDYGLIDYSPDNEAIMVLLKERQLNAIRITVTYSGTAPSIGVIRVGKVLEMARPFYQGHSPAMLSSDSVVRPNVSNSGEWLGASLVRQSRGLSLAWNNLKAGWVRKYWNPFSKTLRTQPFFVAWNPLRFPSDCFYATATQTPKPTNSGPRDYQSITLAATAYSDGSDPVVESLGSKTFSELFTFSRDSEATYYDINGVLQTAASNVPRLTYDPITNAAEGLLIEEARSNVLTNPNRFTDSDWVKSVAGAGVAPSVTPNAAIGPDGRLSASKVSFDCGGLTSADRSLLLNSKTVVNGQNYAGSVWIKSATGIDQIIVMRHAGNAGFSEFTATDEWQRIALIETAISTTGNFQFGLKGNQTAQTGEFYIFGAQQEAGAFSTSYIPEIDTFTSRSTTAQYLDASGDWQLAAVNEERSNAYEYDESGNLQYIGQLLEPARTNAFTYPRYVAPSFGWSFGGVTGYANTEVAPDGTLSASKIVESTATSAHVVSRNMNVNSGTTYTGTFYVKAAERDKVALFLAGATSAGAIFDLTNETTYQLGAGFNNSLTRTIENVGGGWYRCSFTVTAAATELAFYGLYLMTGTAFSGRSYAGDGTSGVYVWGAQLEVGSYPTSLTPDATSFTSRASSATYYDSNGVMQEAAINEYRENTYGYDSNGTLQLAGPVLEPSKTNSWRYSENLFISAVEKVRVFIQPYQELGQTGGISASKLVTDGTASNSHLCRLSLFFSSGVVYTLSVYAKAAELNQIVLALQGGAFGSRKAFQFNLSDGTTQSSSYGTTPTHYGIQPVGDGWYRCWITATAATSISDSGAVVLCESDNTTFTGDYNKGVYLWGAQIEAGSYPSSYIPEGTTFSSRASTATYYDSNGLITTAGSGVARDAAYQWLDGVLYPIGRTLLEAESTNLTLYSEQFDNAAWSKFQATVTANATTAPDGNTTADKAVQDSTAGTVHGITQVPSPSFTSGTTYAASVYAKAAEMDKLELLMSGTAFGTNKSAVFDLTNGTISAGINATAIRSGIDKLGNGWFRCWIADTATTTSAVASFGMYLINAAGSRVFNGDGTSGLYLWGAQVESYTPTAYTAYYATSYIPTTGSTVTRSADSFSFGAVTRAADVSSSPSVTRAADVYTSTAETRAADLCTRTLGVEFNKDAATFYFEYETETAGALLTLGDGTQNNKILLFVNSSFDLNSRFVIDGVTQTPSLSIAGATGTNKKCAFSFDGSTFTVALDGVSTSNATISGNPNGLTLLELGSDAVSTGGATIQDQITIANLKIYPVALSATELEALTA